MQPPIVGPPNKEHNRNNLSIKDASKHSLSYNTNAFSTSTEDNLSTKDKMAGHNVFLYCLFRGSTVVLIDIILHL